MAGEEGQTAVILGCHPAVEGLTRVPAGRLIALNRAILTPHLTPDVWMVHDNPLRHLGDVVSNVPRGTLRGTVWSSVEHQGAWEELRGLHPELVLDLYQPSELIAELGTARLWSWLPLTAWTLRSLWLAMLRASLEGASTIHLRGVLMQGEGDSYRTTPKQVPPYEPHRWPYERNAYHMVVEELQHRGVTVVNPDIPPRRGQGPLSFLRAIRTDGALTRRKV